MLIETHGQQMDVTPALREYVETKLGRLSRLYDPPLQVRTQLSIDKPDHVAEATVSVAGKTLHADARAAAAPALEATTPGATGTAATGSTSGATSGATSTSASISSRA